MKEPDSMDECIYYTNRTIEPNGKIKAWVRKISCPECEKALMGKPVEKGKVRIRAMEYTCPECGHTEPKLEHENKLTVNVIYTCPHCNSHGETTTEYKRKTFNGVPSFVFTCENCGEKIGISKKMKKGKK